MEGLGPLPKRKPRWKRVRRTVAAQVVTALDRADAINARSAALDGFRRVEPEEYHRGTVGAGITLQGANLRPAGPNVPTGVRRRADGTVKKILFPFGAQHVGNPRRKVIA